jgi:hypothetical protein
MDVESVSNSKVKIFEALNARREKLKTVKAAGLWWKRVLETTSQNRRFLLPSHRYRHFFDADSFYAV